MSIDYRYEVLQKQHVEGAVRVMTESFCGYEPMTHFLGMTHAEFKPFAYLVVEKAVRDGLSIVALHGEQVVACTVVEDLADPQDLSAILNPKFNIIFDLLEHLSGDFFRDKVIAKGHIAHLFITAVHSQHHHHGLSRKINFHSIELARAKNFDFMCCEFTHFFNRMGTVKYIEQDKLLIRSYKYDDYEYQGTRPFATLPGTADAYLWELQPGARLCYQDLETKKPVAKAIAEIYFE